MSTSSPTLIKSDESLTIVRGPNGEGMATRQSLIKVIGARGERVNPIVFHYWPLGRRLMVVLDWVSDTLETGLVVPEGARSKIQEQIGSGTVIAVGGMVGQPGAPYPGGPSLKEPSDLLYQHVLFSMYGSSNVMTSLFVKKEFDQHVRMLNDRDLWLLDTSPQEEWGSIG